jgi:hypothetical protein
MKRLTVSALKIFPLLIFVLAAGKTHAASLLLDFGPTTVSGTDAKIITLSMSL